jgi:hypothetical protein
LEGPTLAHSNSHCSPQQLVTQRWAVGNAKCGVKQGLKDENAQRSRNATSEPATAPRQDLVSLAISHEKNTCMTRLENKSSSARNNRKVE